MKKKAQGQGRLETFHKEKTFENDNGRERE